MRFELRDHRSTLAITTGRDRPPMVGAADVVITLTSPGLPESRILLAAGDLRALGGVLVAVAPEK
jgi:hypothetical protein